MSGVVDKRSPSICDPGLTTALVVSCGLSLLVVLSLLRGAFSRFPGFLFSTKTSLSKFQFDLDEGHHTVLTLVREIQCDDII